MAVLRGGGSADAFPALQVMGPLYTLSNHFLTSSMYDSKSRCTGFPSALWRMCPPDASRIHSYDAFVPLSHLYLCVMIQEEKDSQSGLQGLQKIDALWKQVRRQTTFYHTSVIITSYELP